MSIVKRLDSEDLTGISEDILLEVMHRAWIDSMSKKGWSYGAFSEADKTHPNIKPTPMFASNTNHKKELLVILRAYKGMAAVLGTL